ncbi:hypothetical protein ES703_80119 [subsurface metagenome]
MEESKLEKKTGFIPIIRREIEEIIYVGLDHYFGDRIMGYVHHHKESHTSKDNILMHSDLD